jgi:hypothetical protein
MTNPTGTQGRPPHELSDDELEQQGKAAHDSRNWVFLNGTAEQFATHTARMLELEQEYVRRHPKRTWQGSGGAPRDESEIDLLVEALRSIAVQVESILRQHDERSVRADEPGEGVDPVAVMLRAIAAQPGGRMHKLEVHQLAREVGLGRTELARLYTGEPRLLTTDQSDRVLTAEGRRRVEDEADR